MGNNVVNQTGNGAVYIHENSGSVSINCDAKRNPYLIFEDMVRNYSHLRHYEATLKPEIIRPEQDQIIKWVERKANDVKPRRVCFVYGDPGIGKTALTNSIFTLCMAERQSG